MTTEEPQLNGRIATLLDRVNTRWTVLGETQGAFQGSQRKPDILVFPQAARPVAIENEYDPALTVERDAASRLGEILNSEVTGVSGRINAAMALRSSVDLHRCNTHDEIDEMLSNGVELEYALLTGTAPDRYARFPKRGSYEATCETSPHSWDMPLFRRMRFKRRSGSIRILEGGIGAVAAIMRQACEDGDG